MLSRLFANQDAGFLFSLIAIVVAMVLVSVVARGLRRGTMPAFGGPPAQRGEQPQSFWLRTAIYVGLAVVILAVPILGQLNNAGPGNWAAFFWLFGRIFGIGTIILVVMLRGGIRPATGSTPPDPRVVRNSPLARLVWVYLNSVVAITFMVPLVYEGTGNSTWVKDRVLAFALIPAFISWLMIVKWPARENPAFIRGAALAVGLVGAGAIALLPYADQLDGPIREMVTSARFPIQAKVYLGIGMVGLIASFFFGHGQAEQGKI